MDTDIDETVNLSPYTPEEACLWLIEKLRARDFMKLAYTRPYCNYVTTWHKAVPLSAIVMAQSPYPNDIFPPTAAAMSFDPDLCKKVMRKNLPPTVEVLANDISIHTDVKREDVATLIMNGWMLVDSGILLVNEAVFRGRSSGVYDECMDQCNVLDRLLRETEKYGKRTVDVIAYGDAGQRMATSLFKIFKSNIIKLSKFISSHPASLSYRMTNLSSPECHLNSPSTSKTLAKHLRNYVASTHAMAKQSEQELRLQRQTDALRTVGKQLQEFERSTEEWVTKMKDLRTAFNSGNTEEFDRNLGELIRVGEVLRFKTSNTSAAIGQVQTNFSSGGTTSKPGPSLPTTSPSIPSLSQHVGGTFTPQTPLPAKTIKLNKRQSDVDSRSDFTSVSRSQSTTTTNIDTISIPRKVEPIPSISSRTISFRKPPLSTSGATNTPVDKSLVKQASKTDGDDKTISSVSTRFGKLQIVPESSKFGSVGKTKAPEALDPSWTLTKEIINQLSCVEAVLEARISDRIEDEEVSDIIEAIQSDIQSRVAYNAITRDLSTAIKKDLGRNPKFNFGDFITKDTDQSDTYDLCRRKFNF